MNFSKYTSIVLVITLSLVASSLATDWEDCGLSNRNVSFHNIDIRPSDVLIKNGEQVDVGTDVIVAQELDQSALVSIKINKQVGFVHPRVHMSDWKFCDLLKESRIAAFARAMFKKGENDPCTVRPGRYTNSFKRTVDLKSLNLPSIAYRLGSGKYSMEMVFKNQQRKPIGCLRIKAVRVTIKK
jgi:hypothetical protein